MTTDHPVRRLLARLCSAETMQRIVDPTLADMRVEGYRWRGYIALVRALALHAVVSVPESCFRLYHDDQRALPRMLALSFVTAVTAAIPLVALSFRRELRSLEIIALLMPQALALTIPAALLVAIPVALHNVTLTRRLRGRAIVVLVFFVALTGVVMDRVMPHANQAFRELTAGHPLPRGANETALATLQRQIAELKTRRGGETLVRQTEYVLHLRIALMCAPLPLGILALALSATRSGRQRPWLAAGLGLVSYFLTLYPLEFLAEQLLTATTVPPPVLAWMPMTGIALVAAAIYLRDLPHTAESCA
jgi:hypothetical protein